MNDTNIPTLLREQWQHAPASVRSAILDQSYKQSARSAASSYELTEAALDTLEEEVLMVLLRLQSKDEFASALPSTVPDLSSADAEHLATQLDEQFFSLFSPYLDEAPEQAQQVGPRALGSTSPVEQFIHNQEDVEARFNKLPKNVQDAILSAEVAGTFSELVRTHDLEQGAFMTFGTSASRVLVGLATPRDFRQTVAESKIVPDGKHDSFTSTVEDGMFKPVRDAIVQALDARKQGM